MNLRDGGVGMERVAGCVECNELNAMEIEALAEPKTLLPAGQHRLEREMRSRRVAPDSNLHRPDRMLGAPLEGRV